MAWVNSSVRNITWKNIYSVKEDLVTAILLGLFLVLVATFSIRQQDPPLAASTTVSPDAFSAGRAVRHLPFIAERPRPIGSSEHGTVKNYLVSELLAAGIEPQVQQAAVALDKKEPPVQIGVVQNVFGRLKGTGSGKAVLLVAHYDSVLQSFGASDNGAGIASLLETLRALKNGPSLQNDVIFLFTDGEEIGMLGARAFVNEHSWARDVGVVFNFDARGNSGPVIMFETSNGNRWLIEQFAQASSFPVAHSLSYEIYRLLPADTDLTIFKRAGIPGLNFANIDGIDRYHSPLDNLQGVDENSLQHRGSHALGLTRHFGNLDLSYRSETNAIYFDLFGKFLVRYSSLWVVPLTLFVAALFVTLVIVGLRQEKLTVTGIAWGLASFLVSVVVASLLNWLLWKAVWMIRGEPSPEATQSRLLWLSFVVLAIATTLAVYTFARNRVQFENLATGALLWWIVLMVVVTMFLPGASFVFHWPLLFGLIGLGWILLVPEKVQARRWLNAMILSLCAAPGIILLAPVIHQIFVGLTLNWIPLISALVVMLFGFVLPQLRLIAAPYRWVLPGAALGTAIVLLVVGVLTNSAATRRSAPRIFYALNADSGKAIWASDLTHPDDRTSQLFTGNREKGTLADFAYTKKSREYTVSSAPVAQLPAPEVSVLEDKSQDGVRSLRLRLSSPRQAGIFSIYLDSQAEVLSTSINNKPIADVSGAKNAWGLHIDGFPRDGLELQLQLRSSEPLQFRVLDQSFGLPQVNTAPQSQTVSDRPDLTLLVKSFSI